jgi:hypothetical protein
MLGMLETFSDGSKSTGRNWDVLARELRERLVGIFVGLYRGFEVLVIACECYALSQFWKKSLMAGLPRAL